MATVQHNAKLNQLLIDVGRSLLQYVGHCSSWTSQSEVELAKEFPELVNTQQRHVEELAELLISRRWTIDFGGFPATYTDLHFLSLKYLVRQIIINQKAIVAELDEALHNCVDDPEAVSLLREILGSERQITDRLIALAKPPVAV